jgi:FKBP-type peptidyl-prolyl cis-trans isomerase FkpA
MRNVLKPAGIVPMSLILLCLLPVGCLEDDIDYAAREKKEREKYLEENNITVEPTESGLYFIPIDTGYGDFAEMGDRVTINFEGYLLNGNLLTTNIEAVAVEYDMYNPYETYEPYTFVLGDGDMIDGVEEGLTYMREGATAKMIIPSELSFPGSYRSLLYYVYFLDLVQPPD